MKEESKKKNFFIKYIEDKFNSYTKSIVLKQIECFYETLNNYELPKHNYKIGDNVFLKKGTLLHGTYKNLDGLKGIKSSGLISSWFIDGRESKYPSCVGVWNLKNDTLLRDYINFYSGGTIMYCGLVDKGKEISKDNTDIIPYDQMPNIVEITKNVNCHMWYMEQTKEARFMPSLVQDKVQIAVIFNGDNIYAKKLLKGDILNNSIFDDCNVKEFVNENYYDKFIKDRSNKNDFFTDRESAIIFGIPSNLIEGILVGKKYENDVNILRQIKNIFPNCYICNLEGKVIKE